MEPDFKTAIIKVMQESSLLEKPFSELAHDEIDHVYRLLLTLAEYSSDEEITIVDMIKKARLNFNLAELSDVDGDFDRAVIYYKIAFDSLVAGGIDLSMKKWMELVSLRINAKKRNKL